jgi:hypothetical protein
MTVRQTFAAIAALTLISACSSTADGDTKAAVATRSPSPLTAHVIPADGLPGFSADGEPALQTKAEFAEQHDKTVAELDKIGVLSGAGLEFDPEDKNPGFGMSIALQFSSAEEAETEAARLFASNSDAEEGTTVKRLEVPGIPGGRAVQLDGEMKGQPVRGIEIVFVEGTVLHEIFAFTLVDAISVEDLIAAATDLYDEVAGRPVSKS